MPNIIHALQLPHLLPSSSGAEAPTLVDAAVVCEAFAAAAIDASLDEAGALGGGGGFGGALCGIEGIRILIGGTGRGVPSGYFPTGGGALPLGLPSSIAFSFASPPSTRPRCSSNVIDDYLDGGGGGVCSGAKRVTMLAAARVSPALSSTTGCAQCGHGALRTILRLQPGQALAA